MPAWRNMIMIDNPYPEKLTVKFWRSLKIGSLMSLINDKDVVKRLSALQKQCRGLHNSFK